MKTATVQSLGKPGQPVAERTPIGWTIMSPESQDVANPVLLTKSTSANYEQLGALDALGLADTSENDQLMVSKNLRKN